MIYRFSVSAWLMLFTLLLLNCKMAQGQAKNITASTFINGINANEFKAGKFTSTQYEGLRLYNTLQCVLGLPYKGYIIFDSITSQKTYREFNAIWLTPDSLPYFSLVGIRNVKDELEFVAHRLSADDDLSALCIKPDLQDPEIAHSLRMDAPNWNAPNSFRFGVVSLNEYFSFNHVAAKDSITIIGTESDIKRNGFRFTDHNGWAYEVRTTRWDKGAITKIVITQMTAKDALQIIQAYIDYVNCLPDPFFTTRSLGENYAKLYEKDELRGVSAYFQNTIPDYRVTVIFNNNKIKPTLTIKLYNSYYRKKGYQRMNRPLPSVSPTYDVREDALDEESWKALKNSIE